MRDRDLAEKFKRRLTRTRPGKRVAVSSAAANAQPDPATRLLLRNIQTEIGAGMVLFPKSEADHVHNNACSRANTIIDNYAEGFGLFQMTTRNPAALSTVSTPSVEQKPTPKAPR